MFSAMSTDALAKDLKKLKTQGDALDHEIATAQAQYNHRLNIKTPVLKLPSDVLIDIFRMVQKTKGGWKLPFEIIASHVCSHWRQVAVQTPILWSNIRLCQHFCGCEDRYLGLRGPERWWKNRDVLGLYTTRFSTCLLDIKFHFLGWDQYFQVLAPHASKFRCLSLMSPRKPPIQGLESLLSQIHAPYLESLCLDFPILSSTPGPTNPSVPTIFTRGSPLLSVANIQCENNFLWYPSLQTLTTLTLSMRPNITFEHLRDALVSMPILTNLSLNVKVKVSTSINRSSCSRIVLASVRWLRLEYQETVVWMNDYVSLPNLQTVELFQFTMNFIPAGTSSHHDSLRSAQSLVIRDSTSRGPITKLMATFFPKIHTLILDEPEPEPSTEGECGLSDVSDEDNLPIHHYFTPDERVPVFERSLSKPPRGSTRLPEVPWPNLRTLVVVDIGCLHDAALLQGFWSRKKRGHPFEIILVPKNKMTRYYSLKLSDLSRVQCCDDEEIQAISSRLWD